MIGIFKRRKSSVAHPRNKDRGAPLPAEANAQSERIAILRAEVNRLTSELGDYKKKENEIIEALTFAKERSDDYEKEARIRFALENERLAAYRDKWTSRLAALGSAEKLGEEVLDCKRFFEELSKELTAIVEGGEVPREEPEEQYFRECIRLNELGASEARRDVRAESRLTEDELGALLSQLDNK